MARCKCIISMKARVAAAGYRAIAPDHSSFGRSDKLPARSDYNYQMYVDWLREFILDLDLRHITLLCQDCGSPIGLRVLSELSERFDAVVVANTLLPNCELPPRGIPGWPRAQIEQGVAATRHGRHASEQDHCQLFLSAANTTSTYKLSTAMPPSR